MEVLAESEMLFFVCYVNPELNNSQWRVIMLLRYLMNQKDCSSSRIFFSQASFLVREINRLAWTVEQTNKNKQETNKKQIF